MNMICTRMIKRKKSSSLLSKGSQNNLIGEVLIEEIEETEEELIEEIEEIEETGEVVIEEIGGIIEIIEMIGSSMKKDMIEII